MTLIVPSSWPEAGRDASRHENFAVVELPVARQGDINRHRFSAPRRLRALIREARADVLDIHEEPFSVAARQWLAAAPPDLPVVMYTAQNVDKRFPPPFAQYETAAYRRVAALYPCSAQAASVARGKGFAGADRGPAARLRRRGLHARARSRSTTTSSCSCSPGGSCPRRASPTPSRSSPASTPPVRRGSSSSAAGPRRHRRDSVRPTLGVADRLEIVALAADRRARGHLPARALRARPEPPHRDVGGAVRARHRRGPGERRRRRRVRERRDSRGRRRRRRPHRGRRHLRARRPSHRSSPATPPTTSASVSAGFELSRTRTWTQVAARQAELYRRVVAGDVPRVELPRSPEARRAAARAEFGPTAATTAGVRPFALPVLRRGGLVPSALGRHSSTRGAEIAALAARPSSARADDLVVHGEQLLPPFAPGLNSRLRRWPARPRLARSAVSSCSRRSASASSCASPGVVRRPSTPLVISSAGPAGVRGDHRHAGSHALEHDLAERLRQHRAVDEDVELGQLRPDVLAEAAELDLIGDPEPLRLLPSARGVLVLAEHARCR